MDRTSPHTLGRAEFDPLRTFGRTELACRYFPDIQPQSAWLKLRFLLTGIPTLAHLARMRRRYFLPAETRMIVEQLGAP